jgi:thymidylate kinase
MGSIRHVVFEGLPAVGKSEILELLARFYPNDVRVLPELVKETVNRLHLDIFRDRRRLTEALTEAILARAEDVRRIVRAGFICLEESHLGVHRAYARSLGDDAFADVYPRLEALMAKPDAFVRLDVPVAASLERQAARSTPQFDVDGPSLRRMLEHLDRWHAKRETALHVIDAARPAHAVLGDVESLLGLADIARLGALEATFDVILLLGRPAAGKSEFIDFLSSCPAGVRASDFHVAPFAVVDDFPILWELFEDDDLWERLGRRRLYSRRCNGNYAVSDDGLWAFLIGKIDRSAATHLARPGGLARRTLIVEFARGGSKGYADALALLSPGILQRAAILYVSVSFEESWRRNIARYEEANRGGILTHSVPRGEMERTYGTDDWLDLAPDPAGKIEIGGIRIPYVTMPNEPESKDPAVLGPRYRNALDSLYEIRGCRD